MIIRNSQNAFGIDRRLFAPKLLAKKYGNALVDVVNQDPNSTIMEINPRNRQFKRTIKLRKFVEYQSEFDKKARKAEEAANAEGGKAEETKRLRSQSSRNSKE